eukprot:TRINITY_DN4344_c0_g1_i1.p1 TRINITY_DN4344_c0_g1~~TRINITY_DN4344_c0_g1_i1.p1  ORF type:complete len:116 (-),score=10.77 TRINITY_DN4344_c0_g1_i1:18-365(-)
MGLGFGVYVATGTVQARAYIQIKGHPVPGMAPLPFGFKAIGIALLSQVGQYMHLIATWQVLDVYILTDTVLRDVWYTSIGVVLVLAARTFRAHSGVGYADKRLSLIHISEPTRPY